MSSVSAEGGSSLEREQFTGSLDSTTLVRGLLSNLANDLGLEIPIEALPAVELQRGDNPNLVEGAAYDQKRNVIVFIVSKPLIETNIRNYLGLILGEEGGHFLRSYFTNQVGRKTQSLNLQQHTVQEFFGYLTRRLLLRSAQGRGMNTIIFNNDEIGKTLPAKQVLSRLKGIRGRISGAMFGTRWLASMVYNRERVEEIAHQRGYRWAAMVDVERITDWQKLFSLSDEEIQTRFFRENQDYSDL